jgi:hypothetical protein
MLDGWHWLPDYKSRNTLMKLSAGMACDIEKAYKPLG